jgi:hypothetical protein
MKQISAHKLKIPTGFSQKTLSSSSSSSSSFSFLSTMRERERGKGRPMRRGRTSRGPRGGRPASAGERGEAASSGGNEEGGGVAARGKREGRGRCCADGKRRNKKASRTTMVEGLTGEGDIAEAEKKTLIGDEPSVGSTNQRHRGEAFNETNAAALSDSVDDA